MTVADVDALATHLAAWAGAWRADAATLQVVGTATRDRPGWDGQVRRLVGATRPDGAGTVAVAPDLATPVAAALGPDAMFDDVLDRATARAVGEVVAGEGAVLGAGVLRWLTSARGVHEVDERDDGYTTVWLDHTDPRVPAWLHPFGGRALLALDADGAYAAGVGVKRHDRSGHELSVVTDEAHRGRGLARRLVAEAARHELALAPVVTYLHARDNVASARVADAVGFHDHGWHVLGVFGGRAPG